MTFEERGNSVDRGYGNIYTPHAGSMIIHVQRESGLANRTIVLTQRQVRLLRAGGIVLGALIVAGALSWFFLASQAARVPLLTRRVAQMQHDVSRLDTLQHALDELEGRFQQVQRMMGVSTTSTPGAPAAPASAPSEPAPPSVASATPSADSATIPNEWPLPTAGVLLDSARAPGAAGIDIAVSPGTPIRAAGAGTVVEVRDDTQNGKLVRISHRDGYESVYANARAVRVATGAHVAAGAVIAVTGDSASALPAHLHFEVRRGGKDVDPTSLITKGPAHGDLQ
jgi:murein DD-endopeptidase MepM/ murein hydrolase activator NlpD